MRREFARVLEQCMTEEESIEVLVADVGYGVFDGISARYPKRFWNVGASEQAMIGMAVGMALAGKRPVCYSITPFLLWRPAELIRNYLNHEGVPVVLVGSGRSEDYGKDGFTHWSPDDMSLMKLWPNIQACWPPSVAEVRPYLKAALHLAPAYINLRK